MLSVLSPFIPPVVRVATGAATIVSGLWIYDKVTTRKASRSDEKKRKKSKAKSKAKSNAARPNKKRAA